MCNSKLFYSFAFICCSGCCFLALVPLLGQGGFFYLTEVLPKKNKAENWAVRPWSQQNCTVLGKGIAYRGSCKDSWLGDAPSGSECPASDPTWTAEEMNAASACEAVGNSAWADARRLLGAGVDEVSDVDGVSKLHGIQGRRLGCGHSFLPWVQVELAGKKRCAFRFGMAVSVDAAISTTTAADSEAFLKKFVLHNTTSCYIASANDCIVALEFPMHYLADEWAWSVGGWPIYILIQLGWGSLGVGFICCLVLCCMPKDLFDDDDKDTLDTSDTESLMWAESHRH